MSPDGKNAQKLQAGKTAIDRLSMLDDPSSRIGTVFSVLKSQADEADAAADAAIAVPPERMPLVIIAVIL